MADEPVKRASIDPVSGEPKCPDCGSVGDQPHASDCPRGKGWEHAVRPADVW